MKRNIQIEALAQIPLEKQRIEVVERKCIGHPDSIADGVAEAISRALCREYLEEFGVVLHHNTDQGEIVAGESDPKFGGGKVIRPIFILIDGRATKRFNDVSIPTDTIAVEATRNYLRSNFTTLNMERDVIMDCRLGPVRPISAMSSNPTTEGSRGQTIPPSASAMPRSRTLRPS